MCAVVAEHMRVDVDRLLRNRIAAVRESGERRAHMIIQSTVPEPLRAVRREGLECRNVLCIGLDILKH